MTVYVGYGECICKLIHLYHPLTRADSQAQKTFLFEFSFSPLLSPPPPPPPPPPVVFPSFLHSLLRGRRVLESSLSFILFCQNYLSFICLSRVLLCLLQGHIYLQRESRLFLELYPFVMKRFIYLHHSGTPPSPPPPFPSLS